MGSITNRTARRVYVGTYALNPFQTITGISALTSAMQAAITAGHITSSGFTAATADTINTYTNNQGGAAISAVSGVITFPAITVTTPADLTAVGTQLTNIRAALNTILAELTLHATALQSHAARLTQLGG